MYFPFIMSSDGKLSKITFTCVLIYERRLTTIPINNGFLDKTERFLILFYDELND